MTSSRSGGTAAADCGPAAARYEETGIEQRTLVDLLRERHRLGDEAGRMGPSTPPNYAMQRTGA